MTERQQFRDKSFAQNELFNRKVEFFLWALLHLIFAFFYHKISSMNSKVRVKNTKLEKFQWNLQPRLQKPICHGVTWTLKAFMISERGA